MPLLGEVTGVEGDDGLFDFSMVADHRGFLSDDGVGPAVDEIIGLQVVFVSAVDVYLCVKVFIEAVCNAVIGECLDEIADH